MKLVTRLNTSQQAPNYRRRSALIKWLRSRSGLERALLVKVALTLIVLAIAVWAVSAEAHALQVLNQSIEK